MVNIAIMLTVPAFTCQYITPEQDGFHVLAARAEGNELRIILKIVVFH